MLAGGNEVPLTGCTARPCSLRGPPQQIMYHPVLDGGGLTSLPGLAFRPRSSMLTVRNPLVVRPLPPPSPLDLLIIAVGLEDSGAT